MKKCDQCEKVAVYEIKNDMSDRIMYMCMNHYYEWLFDKNNDPSEEGMCESCQ